LARSARWDRHAGQNENEIQATSRMAVQTLAELYDAYGARLYRYAVLVLADRAAAEDAVQEVFVKVAPMLDDATISITFAYLAASVRNTCYSMLRRTRVRAGATEPLIELVAPGSTEEERMVIDDALRTLPAEQREVVYLKVFEGLTFQEIADRCGVSINTAASRYRYATQTLRRVLRPGDQAC
jgi:RNA polymerase sigma-70 factor, ECF subfamily